MKEEITKKFRVLVLIVLISSLLVNIVVLINLNKLNDTVSDLRQNQQGTEFAINEQGYQIRKELEHLRQEQSWVGSFASDLQLVNDQVEVSVEWQVKELPTDAEVVFHYLFNDDETYQSVSAEEIEQGFFRVNIPLDTVHEPVWEQGVFIESMNNEAMVEQSVGEIGLESMKYYISVVSEDAIKSSAVQIESIESEGTHYYSRLQSDVNIHEDETMRIMLTSYRPNDQSIMVDEANLFIYKNQQLVEEHALLFDEQSSNQEVRYFYLDDVEHEENINLVMSVVYDNGEVFEKQIYNNDDIIR